MLLYLLYFSRLMRNEQFDNENLLDVLVCSIAQYFQELFVF